MKKIIQVFKVFLILLLIIPINANAKTLGQLKKEYDALEQKYRNKGNEIKENEKQTKETNNRIQEIYGEISQAESDIKSLNEEITQLNIQIKEKGIQVNELMKFFEVSEGESIYLEYIFKAESITDFIYRVSVTEQLSNYNNKLIDEMNTMIETNKNNIAQLTEKEENLKTLQEELKAKLITLGEEKETLSDEEESIEKDIQYTKAIINYYIGAGCKESQDIATCANAQLPPDTQFWRPLNSGIMYSTWWSDVLSGGGCRSHAGVDIANNYGTNVYPIANGQVVFAGYASDGYGNKIIVHHNINGRNYSSLYGHLSSINVSKGQIVTKDQVIGHVGSTGHSFGNHLHLNVCVGLKSCVSRGDTVDPGTYINFPANKVWFYDRTSFYSGYYSNPCRW